MSIIYTAYLPVSIRDEADMLYFCIIIGDRGPSGGGQRIGGAESVRTVVGYGGVGGRWVVWRVWYSGIFQGLEVTTKKSV